MRALHRLALTLLLVLGPASQAAAPPPPDPQAMMQALARAAAAVVGVEVRAAEGARSAETLGRDRTGSGVVIGTDGLVLTIGYLVLEADRVQLTTQDGKTHPARLVAYDLATGFGLVQSLLPLRDVAAVPLGIAGGLSAGQPLLAITGGEDGDVANVQLVARRPFSGYWEYHIDSALFTTPPIANHSGAALFNHRGELVGIGSLFVMSTLGGERRLPGNMFVPVDLLRPVLEEMRATGTTRASRRPWLGLSSTDQDGRVQIVRVNRDGPADLAGLQPGDVVLAVDGAKVETLEAFYKKLWEQPDPQGEIELTVLQGAEVRKLRLRAADRMQLLRKPGGT